MCCKEMFKKWLDTQPKANWGQLIEALREVELTDAAELLQRRLSGELCLLMLQFSSFNLIHHIALYVLCSIFLCVIRTAANGRMYDRTILCIHVICEFLFTQGWVTHLKCHSFIIHFDHNKTNAKFYQLLIISSGICNIDNTLEFY